MDDQSMFEDDGSSAPQGGYQSPAGTDAAEELTVTPGFTTDLGASSTPLANTPAEPSSATPAAQGTPSSPRTPTTEAAASAAANAKMNARAVIERCLSRNLLVEGDLISMLGESRHHLTLPELERALVRNSVLSDASLAALKAEIGGYQLLPNMRIPTRTDILDKDASRQLGAVVLAGEPAAVAIVEDLPASLDLLRSRLGTFTIYAATVAQFAELHKRAYTNEASVDIEPLGDIYTVFDEAIRRRASDIHLSVGLPPGLRIDGKLEPLALEPVDTAWMRSEIARIAGPQRLAKLESNHDVDLAFPYGSARFRVNFGADRRGPTMAARKIPTRVPTMDELALPHSVQNFINLDRGLVLVTGATGSGKSTTLAALLAQICTSQKRHLITLEDPIEFILPQGSSVVHQRELGTSFSSFPEGLRQALRQDPDVVLVGEMRDLSTIRTAITAAETGHLVFGTLHTFDAASTVSRLVAMYPSEEQDQIRSTLSYTLKGIVSQTLLRSISGKGRVAAFEVMVTNFGIANNLRKIDGAVHLRGAIETGSRDGMQTMDMALADLVRRRLITEEEALEKVVDAADFKRRMSD
jgi:twitching motility protein PilT